MLMREVFDAPSPLERMCALALGMDEEAAEADTALIDHVTRLARDQQDQREGSSTSEPNAPADFSPGPEFYERFAALLQETLALPPQEVA